MRISVSPEWEARRNVAFVGENPEEAFDGLPFDSFDSADSYRQDQGGNIYTNIYTAKVSVPSSDMLVEA